MKLPTKVVIASQEWKVKTMPGKSGGSFDAGKCLITVGMKYPHDIFEIFLHECMEAIMAVRNSRYEDSHGYYVFAMFHDDFSILCKDLAYALKDVLK